MSYNGSGTFQINTSGQPVVAGTVISSTAFNALTADLATGLSTAITKDGQTTTTARIPFAQGISSTLTTDSSSVSTGSIITAGGVGIVKNLYVGANTNIAGTLGVTGVATFSAAPIYSSLTASSAVATDASKALVSVTNTGTGNNVLATSPTLVTPVLGAASATSITVAAGTVSDPAITTSGDTNTGIFFPAADTIAFAEGGTEAMRIDSSGNVGIGTSSPSYRLEVKGPAATAGQLSIHDGTGDTVVSGNNAASLLFQARDTSVRTIAEIDAVNTTTNGTGGAMVFQTRGSDVLAERMRIDSDGGVRINNTSNATFSAQLNTQFTTGFQCGMYLKVTNTSSSQSMMIFGNTNNDAVGSISTNGSATSYATSSDYRLKQDIAPMTGALAKIALLKPVTYKWKVDGSDGEGFIAHELAEVCPNAVNGEKDAVQTVEIKDEDGNVAGTEERPIHQGIDTSFLVATLTAAIQEQQAIITAMTARITALENK
jgi:hypothetical protein